MFAVYRLKSSGWALPAVFALTGFMGYTLGPLLSAILNLPGGATTIALALGTTGATFLVLSAYVLATKKDFSFMGGFLFAGMIIAILASLANIFFQLPALAMAVSGVVALLSVGMILFETSRIVNGGERNYVMATVSLFVSLFNLFTSLLSLFGFAGRDEPIELGHVLGLTEGNQIATELAPNCPGRSESADATTSFILDPGRSEAICRFLGVEH